MSLSPGAFVRLKSDPGRAGILLEGERIAAGATMVQVQFGDGKVSMVPLGALEAVPSKPETMFSRFAAGRFVEPNSLRRILTRLRVTGRLSDVVYSMEATETDFYAYQFKPVVKLMNSPTDAMLIADEVGLGKTIEAGLVWTELRARLECNRLLVICPKTLCQKWQDELRGRFGVEAQIANARDLLQTIEREMAYHTGDTLNTEKPYELWLTAFDWKPEKYQVLTPHRGELHGVEALNEAIQDRVAAGVMHRYGLLDGITLYDKVIQYRNRPQSNPIWAYNFNARRAERVEVFNGEIGFVQKHNFDKKPGGRLKRFQVKFERKNHLAVGYGSELSANGGFESVEDNLELAYAISVHKAQGSEFNHSYVVVPRAKGRSLSSELLYTALTRARQHCTLLVQGDVSTLLSARRPENAQTGLINSSLFDGFFRAVPDELINRKGWYEEGRIHEALSGDMVRSKSELVIANLLHERDVPFSYEVLLRAPDGTAYLPDFTISWQGETWFWEHWGMMSSDSYQKHRERKIAWYEKHFPGRLVETFEGPQLSQDVVDKINQCFFA